MFLNNGCSYMNTTDADQYLVYLLPYGMTFTIATVKPGETWNQGPLEEISDVYDTMEEARAYISTRMNW